MFDVGVDPTTGSEYLAILLSQPVFYAHIRLLTVGLPQAVQILEQCADRLPLLEELHVSFPSSFDLNQNALQALVQSVPSPISCPRLKTLGINVNDRLLRAPERVTLPIALKRALVGLFQSQEDDVCVETHPSVEWIE